jgi:eukaryotic-like serine/threonine-protein kinase
VTELKGARVCPVCGTEAKTPRCGNDGAPTLVAAWVYSVLRPRDRGDIIDGRYEIVAQLHLGTSSRVYAAQQLTTGRSVAVKMLASDPLGTGDPVVARFRREARLISALTSRHVMQVLDYGTDEGAPYMALELVRGLSLDHLLAQAQEAGKPLGAEVAAEIAAGVLRALGDAHIAGLVHRNIKPAHIFFDHTGQDELDVKLGGFGAVRPDGSTMTRTGQMLSSPAYMSPEAVMAKPLDGRMDLYALGAVLFRVLANRLPYAAPNRMVIMAMHVNEPVPEPPVDGGSPIGAPMAAFVKRLLQKSCDDRFVDAMEALNALQELAGRSLVDPVHLKSLA